MRSSLSFPALARRPWHGLYRRQWQKSKPTRPILTAHVHHRGHYCSSLPAQCSLALPRLTCFDRFVSSYWAAFGSSFVPCCHLIHLKLEFGGDCKSGRSSGRDQSWYPFITSVNQTCHSSFFLPLVHSSSCPCIATETLA